MEQKQFGMASILVVALIFVIGGIAVYVTCPTSSPHTSQARVQMHTQKHKAKIKLLSTIIMGKVKYNPFQVITATSKSQDYNNQPIVQCIPSGSSSQSQETINYPSQTVTKVNVHVSGGYYPYPSYYSRYYSYQVLSLSTVSQISLLSTVS